MSKTIKERHVEAIVMENTITSIKAYDQAAEKSEDITESLMVDFLVWVRRYPHASAYSEKSLLGRFKKETGL